MYWKNARTTTNHIVLLLTECITSLNDLLMGSPLVLLCSKKQSSNALGTDREGAYYNGFVSQKDKMQMYNINRTLEIA